MTLLSDKGVEVTVGTNTDRRSLWNGREADTIQAAEHETAPKTCAKNLCKDVKGAKPISLNVEDSEALEAEVGKVDGEARLQSLYLALLRRFLLPSA